MKRRLGLDSSSTQGEVRADRIVPIRGGLSRAKEARDLPRDPTDIRKFQFLPVSQGSSQPQAAVDLDRSAGAIVVLEDEERRPPDLFGLT